MSIVYRSSEWRDGSPRGGWGPGTGRKASRSEILGASERAHARKSEGPDMGKLDPERGIAGGRVPVLLPVLQVRQQLSD